VKPETAGYLDKAQTLLSEAEAILGIHLHEAARRTAYPAAFHATQALIFEKTGQTPKTHSGVHTGFLRLPRSDLRIPIDLRIFLSQSYNLKVVSDYAIGPGASVTADIAAAAIATGRRFAAQIVILPDDT